MDTHAPHALELPKALAYLAGFAASEAGYLACLSVRPLESFADIRREAALFDQGRLWLAHTKARPEPFPDLEAIFRLLSGLSSVPDQDALFALRLVLLQGREKVAVLMGDTNAAQAPSWPLWAERCRQLSMPEKSLSALQRCLSDDGNIKDEASPELLQVREELRGLHRQCARKVKEYAAEYNIQHFLQDSYMTLSSDRYVLPLKTNFKGRLQGVVHDYSQTGETCYFEPLFLVVLNNRLQELKRSEREEERAILAYLSALAREELPGIRALYDFLVALDVLSAKVALADACNGRMVDFAEDRGVLLREARHPLLALAASRAAGKALHVHEARQQALAACLSFPEQAGRVPKPEDKPRQAERHTDHSVPGKFGGVVASTLELFPGQRALIVSGGNAGGKTVSLKSLGLITLMSLCALPVPVEQGSVLPLWGKVHAFIGDEQSLEDHVSTFTAQITHLSRMWSTLGTDCLVILDEFGAGTDPAQGAALAQAVVDSLMEHGATVMAATHFPALKAYALSTEGVRAASVLFDPKTRKPLFRLAYDQVGASQALDVARRHGLPEEVLRRAEQYLQWGGEDTGALVERINSLAVRRESEIAALAGERAALSRQRNALQEKFADEQKRLLSSIQTDARQVLAAWKAAKTSHKRTLKELSMLRNKLAESGQDGARASGPPLDLSSLTLRQPLRHTGWNRTGTLLEVDTRKKRLRLDLGGVSLWADAKDIVLPEEQGGKKDKKTKEASSGGAGAFFSGNAPLRLDLRGMHADLAISELEKFLDNAVLSGRDSVEVLHGRGTGVLRREAHAVLKNFPAVRAYLLAPEDQGGDGITIVELK